MLPFLYFLDEYARKVVNGNEMKKWRGWNMDKTLLHKLTLADLAHATLAYLRDQECGLDGRLGNRNRGKEVLARKVKKKNKSTIGIF